MTNKTEKIFIVINKHQRAMLKSGSIKPAMLNQNQAYLQLNLDNEANYVDSIKYSTDEINAFKASGDTAPCKVAPETINKNYNFSEKTLPTGESLFKRVWGMGKLELDAGETGDFEFQIPYGWAKLEGITIMDQTDDLQAELFIEDDEAGTYSETGISREPLNQFGFYVEVPYGFYEKKSDFDSDLYLGMWVVLQITNTSTVSQKVRANIELDEVK